MPPIPNHSKVPLVGVVLSALVLVALGASTLFTVISYVTR